MVSVICDSPVSRVAADIGVAAKRQKQHNSKASSLRGNPFIFFLFLFIKIPPASSISTIQAHIIHIMSHQFTTLFCNLMVLYEENHVYHNGQKHKMSQKVTFSEFVPIWLCLYISFSFQDKKPGPLNNLVRVPGQIHYQILRWKWNYIIPIPPPGIAGAGLSTLISTTTDSVVSKVAATLVAF